MRAKVHGIERNIADHPEHVEHYIETLDGQKRKCNLAASSSKFRSRSASPYTPSPSKPARAVLAIHVGGDSSSSESNIIGSDSDEEHRRVYVTTAADQTMNRSNERPTKPRLGDRERDQDGAGGHKSCTHYGSKRHGDRGCWKRLTCQKSGRRGHPSDKCFYGCAACGEVHDGDKARWKFLQHAPQVVRADQTCRNASS